MSEKVDQVAQVVNRAGLCDWRLEACGAGQCQCRKLARSVIAEMREPTEAMLEAGPGAPYMDRDVWGKMIDEALK